MGEEDSIYLSTQDLLNHLSSTGGEHLNYVVLDDKVVLAKVNANGNRIKGHRKVADWALSKHALLSGRQKVYCSGELWYDRVKKCFIINNDSGTYEPSLERARVAVELINKIFDTKRFGSSFKVAEELHNE